MSILQKYEHRNYSNFHLTNYRATYKQTGSTILGSHDHPRAEGRQVM